MPYKPFGHKDPALKPKPIKHKTKLQKAGILAKPGSLTSIEKSIIGHLVQDTPGDIPNTQVEATALALRRNPAIVRSEMTKARDKLVERAEWYVDKHAESLTKALEIGEVGEARKAAEWAIEKISARDKDGKVERIIEGATIADTQPKIMIGINLGGLGALPSGARV